MFFCDKNTCTVLNTAFQIFSAVTKNSCHLRHHTFQRSQKYLYSGKNTKKNLLQLRCSNVLLHLKYKIFLCEPKIEFNNFALATDHRELDTPRGTSHLRVDVGVPFDWSRNCVKLKLNAFLIHISAFSPDLQFHINNQICSFLRQSTKWEK